MTIARLSVFQHISSYAGYVFTETNRETASFTASDLCKITYAFLMRRYQIISLFYLATSVCSIVLWDTPRGDHRFLLHRTSQSFRMLSQDTAYRRSHKHTNWVQEYP